MYTHMLPAMWIIQVFYIMPRHYTNCRLILGNVNKAYDYQYYFTNNVGSGARGGLRGCKPPSKFSSMSRLKFTNFTSLKYKELVLNI
jgi:hypothetical protein